MDSKRIIAKVKAKLAKKRKKPEWDARKIIILEIDKGKIEINSKNIKPKDIPEEIIKKLQSSVDDKGYAVIEYDVLASVDPGSSGSWDEAPYGPSIDDAKIENEELNGKKDPSLNDLNLDFVLDYLDVDDFDPID